MDGNDKLSQSIARQKVARVSVSENYIAGGRRALIEEGEPTRFETIRMNSDFAADLRTHNVVYDGRVKSDFLAKLLSWLLPIALLIGFWWFPDPPPGRPYTGGHAIVT